MDTWPSAWTLSAQSESNYNWGASQWAIPCKPPPASTTEIMAMINTT